MVLVFTVVVGNAQIVTIPDANFKAKLLAADNLNGIALDAFANSIKIDTNDNGQIEESEALTVVSLYVSNSNIYDLSGIENFANLKTFTCSNNLLTTLETSSLYNLQNLDCRYNELQVLNLNYLSNLQNLNCEFNQLTALDTSGLNNLQSIHCSNNQLSSLNIQGMGNLIELYCDYNHLTTLNANDLDNLLYLSCIYNELTTLMLHNLNNLQRLECRNNQLTTLDLSNSIHMEFVGCQYNNQLTSLYLKNGANESLNANHSLNISYVCADDFQIWEIQSRVPSGCTINSDCNLGTSEVNHLVNKIRIYPNPTKNIMNIGCNDYINSISIYNTQGQLWQINANPTETIDVSGLKTGTYFIKIISDKGTASSKFLKE